jgi:hypothetical protein
MTVDELAERLSWGEFVEWQTVLKLESDELKKRTGKGGAASKGTTSRARPRKR